MAVEADLIRSGVRLRWIGDGTGRLTVRDLWALVESWKSDPTSALYRAAAPDGWVSVAQQVQVDQLNALLLLNHTLRAVNGDKKQGKYRPLRSYRGSPFDPPSKAFAPGGSLGGYRKMSRAEAAAWLESRGISRK